MLLNFRIVPITRISLERFEYFQLKGFKRGRRTYLVQFNQNHEVDRARCLHMYLEKLALNASMRKREVFDYESFVHECCSRIDESLWDPSDDNNKPT